MTAPLWGGRFESDLDPAVHAFTTSLSFDRRLVRHDLVASMAHARSLWEGGALGDEDARSILDGLSELLSEVEEGLRVEGADEDVHSWIERTLAERVGEPARRLHTGRSRNDQTGAALRLWTREAVADTAKAAAALQEEWISRAAEHRETWLPGYTHLQRGQPVSLAHHLLAHVWSLAADGERLRSVHERAGVSPLGAGALAGTPHPVRPERTARLLGFRRSYPNSLLAVADRDYVAEALFAAALLMIHLARWAEEVVLWTSSEFGFAALSDEVAQGSSLMPQKRNPEAAELIRGKSGRAVGDLTSLLVTLKGLPLAYNSDLQEDKEPLFDAVDTARESLRCAGAVTRGLEFRPEKMEAALRGGHLTATDLADHMVGLGVPFRTAHERAGRVVREAEARGCELWELPDRVLAECCPEVADDPEAARAALAPERSVRSRKGRGGPAPERVAEQLEEARAAARELRAWAEGLEPPPVYRAWREGTLTREEMGT